MAVSEGIHIAGFGRDARGVIIAGLGTCALTACTWWSARGGLPTPQVSAVILVLIVVGLASGLVSGHFRFAPVAWVAAVIGSWLAYAATSAIDPSLPPPDSSFPGHELLNTAFLMPFVGGGHLLGAWARRATRRSLLSATLAGAPICALCLYVWWDMPYNIARNPGVEIALLVWVGSGIGAGLVSGRFRDAPASWATAVIGFMVAYVGAYAIEAGDQGPVESLVYGPVALLVIIGGGHLAGAAAWTGGRRLRTVRSPAGA